MNLNQVTLPATDIHRAISFYTKLGLRILVRSPHYARFELPQGEATLSVHLAEEPLPESGIWIYFECSDLDERVRLLQQASDMHLL